MRSLHLEHFITSEVVFHTCRTTQTVAKCVHYLFVLRGAKKNGLHFIYDLPNLHFIYCLDFSSCSESCSWEVQNYAHSWQLHKISQPILTKLKKLKAKKKYFLNHYMSRYIPLSMLLVTIQRYILTPSCSYLGITSMIDMRFGINSGKSKVVVWKKIL